MPARYLVLAILLFWTATTAWLFYRDLWPRLRPGQPPPFTIDLADEARNNPPISWSVFRQDQKIGMVQTRLEYRESDDTFELHSKSMKQLDWGQVGPLQIQFRDMAAMYRVTREGQLRQMIADLTISVGGIGLLHGLRVEAQAHVEGQVKDGRFTPHGSIKFDGRTIDLPLEPVEVSSQGSVLNPLHPVNRVRGLRKGQHWQMPLVNPLNDSLTALLKKDPGAELLLRGQAGVRILQAEVLPHTRTLAWKGQEVSCLVIEYHGDDLTARTWVRESDGWVLRQEASFWGDQLVMVRD